MIIINITKTDKTGLRTIASILVSTILMWCLCFFNTVSAQQFDQSYLKWKAEQEAQDAKLKKVDDRYYLSRPSVSTSSTQKSKSSATQSNSNIGAKIRLNSASVSELQQLDGVGEKKAQAIVEYRQQNGPFKSINELQNVKGIGPKMLEKNKSKLSL